MRLSNASVQLAKERPRALITQPELPHLPPPMTANRALDFQREQKEMVSAYGDELHPRQDD